MMTTDNSIIYKKPSGKKKGKTSPSSPTVPNDPWHDWKPDYATKTSTHQQQETHSPTESVTVRLTAEKTTQQSQRRIVDARLWDSMSATQQRSALEIVRAFESLGKGLGFVTSNWERIPGGQGGGNIAESHARSMDMYVDWTKACHKENISHSMVIDVLVMGFSCKMIDRDRRVRTGSTRRNLLDGLSLYCALRGWPVA